jgi:hypothetical protein
VPSAERLRSLVPSCYRRIIPVYPRFDVPAIDQ